MKIISRKNAKLRGRKRYFNGRSCRNGHISPRRVSDGGCEGCTAVHHDESKQRAKITHAKFYNEHNEINILKAAKTRSRRKGIDFAITSKDILIPDVCPYLGIPLMVAHVPHGGPSDNSPSLDRIDSLKGYIPGNIEVISHRANSIKNKGTAMEHFAIAVRMSERDEVFACV